MQTLAQRLAYEPRELRFGTSGRRGEVVHLSQLEIYTNARAEIEYLQTLSAQTGGVARGDEFFFAYDLRPSSTAFVPEQNGRGEIAQTVQRAIRDAGLRPVNLGCLPTPALTDYALRRGKASIMVTGSHIPFDRNGYKLNTSVGELLKEHEAPISTAVAALRASICGQRFDDSQFDERGFFKVPEPLLPVTEGAAEAYLRRYTGFFPAGALSGMRLLVYQHSAVARDLLLRLLQYLGAETVPAGRANGFVPIDTENIDAEQLQLIQGLVDSAGGAFDAVVSTDGDSDRPLILGFQNGKVRFFGGDLVGMIVAAYLKADAVVVPVSCNDSIDRGPLAHVLEPKTRIGSPFVIAGIEHAKRAGKQVVCGWEANGGFLLGSDVYRDGKTLPALPTRDAFLPIVCTLLSARQQGTSLCGMFGGVCTRFSRAGLLKNFPRPVSLKILDLFAPGDHAKTCATLARFFQPELGFAEVEHIDYTDGVRVRFTNGEIAHLRPSGNADELRIYAVADSQHRAEQIVTFALAEPDGILRAMERFVQ